MFKIYWQLNNNAYFTSNHLFIIQSGTVPGNARSNLAVPPVMGYGITTANAVSYALGNHALFGLAQVGLKHHIAGPGFGVEPLIRESRTICKEKFEISAIRYLMYPNFIRWNCGKSWNWLCMAPPKLRMPTGLLSLGL